MYNNLQSQLDALMIVPDLRLFDTHHFTEEGRMDISAEELRYPSTAFGELRRLAIQEHCKKKRAAQLISVWYGRHLVQRGFIKNPDRQRELFAPDDDGWNEASRNFALFGRDDREQPPQSLRRRRAKLPSRGKFLIFPSSRQRRSKHRIVEEDNSIGGISNSNDNSEDLEPRTTLDDSRLEAMEKGEGQPKSHKTKDSSHDNSDNNDVSGSHPENLAKACGENEVEQELDHCKKQTALDVIAAMDFGTPSKKSYF